MNDHLLIQTRPTTHVFSLASNQKYTTILVNLEYVVSILRHTGSSTATLILKDNTTYEVIIHPSIRLEELFS